MSASFDIFTSTIVTTASSTVTFRSAFVILLAAQLSQLGTYNYQSNFLDRWWPLYNPMAYSIWFWEWYVSVPDNACQRQYYGSYGYLGNSLTFDFIVVGSGAGGAAVASRLAESPKNWSVLLIEAGSDAGADSVVPQFFPFQLNNSQTWNYTAQVVTTSSRAFKKGTDCTCGKSLGGSTSTNAMMYVCGNDRDYNSWAAAGNTGWDYASIQQYIRKSENNTNSTIVNFRPGYHGVGGPVTVSNYGSTDAYIPIIRSAHASLGYPILTDYNSGQYQGFVEIQATIKNKERCNSARSYILPKVTSNPNLYVMKNSLVHKVTFFGNIATGVIVEGFNNTCNNITLTASKEVIVSAGGLNSPKLLMQSGVGKAAELTPLGIPRVSLVDVPVGDNFQDHVVGLSFIMVNPNSPPQTVLTLLNDANNYFNSTNRTGSFTNLGLMNYNGFINVSSTTAQYPDVQQMWVHYPKDQPFLNIILSNFGFKDEFMAPIIAANANYDILIVYTNLLNPKSVGTVKAQSSSSSAPPKITTNYLTDAGGVDKNILVKAIRVVQNIINTPVMQASFAEMIRFTLTDCDAQFTYDTDAYWGCYLSYFTSSMWHPTGTCKMGSSSATAVVDKTLKVYGVSKLRVCDASIMPSVPSGNTQCPTYMIGEKCADLIKADWPF